MKQFTLVVPGPLATRTGGSIYDRRVAEALMARQWTVSVIELEPVSHPLNPPLDTARAQFAAVPDGAAVLVDGLVFGTMPEIVESNASRLRFVPIIHLPLHATPGLTPGEAGWLSNLERRALVHARHIVITGHRTLPDARAMIGRSDDSMITRIPPGTDPAEHLSVAHRVTEPVRLLCVANVTAGKGHDVLIQALSAVAGVEWILTCAGSTTRDAAFAAALHAFARERGLESRITWAGELDDEGLRREYANADVFVLATRSETYGMAVAEAIAHGLPVISTRTGEIPSIAGEGALIVECGEAPALSVALDRVLRDRTLRTTLAAGARRAAATLPTWDAAGEAMERVLIKAGAGG